MSRAALLASLALTGVISLAPVYGATPPAAAEEPSYALDRGPSEEGTAETLAVLDAVTAPPAPANDLRDALAHVVIERNLMASQRDSLLQQRWLMIGYAAVASLLALWFMQVSLRRRAAPGPTTGTVTVTSATRKRTNATITIRNATTQQAEITDRVATRRLFRKPAPPDATTRVMTQPTPALVKPTAPTARVAPAAPAAAPVVVRPAPTPAPRPTPPMPRRAEVHEYPPTDALPVAKVVGTRPSILLAADVDDVIPEVLTEPETTTQVRIARRDGRELARQGLSLLEVMISLAILATVLASVSAGIFTLSSSRQSANEEAVIGGMMRVWSERIMGADWEWLGRDHLDDPLRGAWSWQRPETTEAPAAGDHPPLAERVKDPLHDAKVQLLDEEPSGVTDLRCYLEYYRPVAMELCFTPAAGANPRATWDEVRHAYRLPPPIDLRQQVDAVVVRLSATWRSQGGGQRRRDLVFARTR